MPWARSAASFCASSLSCRSDRNPKAANTITGSTINSACQKNVAFRFAFGARIVEEVLLSSYSLIMKMKELSCFRKIDRLAVYGADTMLTKGPSPQPSPPRRRGRRSAPCFIRQTLIAALRQLFAVFYPMFSAARKSAGSKAANILARYGRFRPPRR
jgi:hypothetical protein